LIIIDVIIDVNDDRLVYVVNDV